MFLHEEVIITVPVVFNWISVRVGARRYGGLFELLFELSGLGFLSQARDPVLGYGFLVNWCLAILCGRSSTFGDNCQLGCVEQTVASGKLLSIDLCKLEHLLILHDVDSFEVRSAGLLGQVLQLSVLGIHLL